MLPILLGSIIGLFIISPIGLELSCSAGAAIGPDSLLEKYALRFRNADSGILLALRRKRWERVSTWLQWSVVRTVRNQMPQNNATKQSIQMYASG
jgi:hypothetical protein